MHPTYILHPEPYTMHHTPYTSHPTPHTLNTALSLNSGTPAALPYTLRPTLYTLHSLDALHSTLNSLRCTLHTHSLRPTHYTRP